MVRVRARHRLRKSGKEFDDPVMKQHKRILKINKKRTDLSYSIDKKGPFNEKLRLKISVA